MQVGSNPERDAEPEQSAEKGKQSKWLALIRMTGSPLKLFALIVLVCNSVFGIAAASSYDDTIFIYTLHTFLAVVASFVLIALWSPRSFYTPTELLSLAELEAKNPDGKSVFPQSRPIVPTLIIAAFILVYGVYQNNI